MATILRAQSYMKFGFDFEEIDKKRLQMTVKKAVNEILNLRTRKS